MRPNRYMTLTIAGLLLSMLTLTSGCGSDEDTSGVAGESVQIQLSSAASLDRTFWQFISARTIQDTEVFDQVCLPYNLVTQVPEIQVPSSGEFRLEVDIFSGQDVCAPGGGGVLLARGVLLNEGVDAAELVPGALTVPVGPVGAFVETSYILGGAATAPQESRFGAGFVLLPNGLLMTVGGGELKSDTLLTAPTEDLPIWQRAEQLTNLRATIELYDTQTGDWTLLGAEEGSSQRLPKGRIFASLIYLEDLNSVAVVGGYESGEDGAVIPATNIVLIDLATMTPLPENASGGTLLPRIGSSVNRIEAEEGSLLFIAGGVGEEASLSYEVIRPSPAGASGQDHVRGFGSLPRARWNHTATHLTSQSGVEQIYLVGGETSTSLVKLIDVFDVSGKQFFAAPAGADAVTGLSESGKVGHATVFVSSLNAIYVIGGYTSKDRTTQTARIEVIEVDTGVALTDELSTFNLVRSRANHQAIALNDRSVLVTGGVTLEDETNPLLTPADEWIGSTGIDPATGDDVVSAQSFTGMLNRRLGHNASLLPNGQVLVFGGFRLLADMNLETIPVGDGSHNAELYTPIPTGAQ